MRIKLQPKKVKHILEYAYNSDISVILNGLHGIGKSTAVEQFAEEKRLHLEPLFLSINDPGDLLGSQVPDYKNNRSVWLEPDWFQNIVDLAWPKTFHFNDLEFLDKEFQEYVKSNIESNNIDRDLLNDLYISFYKKTQNILFLTTNQNNVHCNLSKGSVLFLDELNRAPDETRQVALQLVLKKELQSHKLPFVKGKCTMIISAINPSDIYHVEELDLALLDRFLFIDMICSAEDWLRYATSKNLNDCLISYISENPSHIHNIDKKTTLSCTPRSLEQLSKLLENKIDDSELLQAIINGSIGEEVGSNFYAYYKNWSSMVTIDNIVEIVYNYKRSGVNDISHISENLKETVNKIPSPRKYALLDQNLSLCQEEFSSKKYNIFTFTILSLLTALSSEITIAFCKDLKVNNIDIFSELVEADKTINDYNFFRSLTKFL